MLFNTLINNFSSGEWSPKMRLRQETEQYPRACETIYNFIPQMTGGAAYRGGTTIQRFFSNVTEQDAVLVDGINTDLKILAYLPSNLTYRNILTINPGSNSWRVLNGSNVTLTGTTTTSGWVPQLTDYVQVGDLLILTCKNGQHPPKVFYRNPSGGAYTVANLVGEYITDKPWEVNPWGPISLSSGNSYMAIQVPPQANTVGTVFTALTPGVPLSSSYVGRYIRLCNGTSPEGVVQITAVTGVAQVTVVLLSPLHTTSTFTYGDPSNPSSFFQLSQWYTGNWPKTVTTHQGRLIFGGSNLDPMTLWGSRISNIFDFAEVPSPDTTGVGGFASAAWTSDNSRPFTLTPTAGGSGAITALSSAKTLVINTDVSEIVAYGSNGALGPINVVFDSSTSFGASTVTPTRVNNFLTFVQGSGTRLRDVIFNFNEDQYKSNDLSFLADHLYETYFDPYGLDQITEMARWQNKSSVLIVRTRYGKVYGVTLDRDYGINAWFRLDLGVSPIQKALPLDDTTPNYAHVLSCTVSINPVTREQELILATIRYFGGAMRYCLEKVNQPWENKNPSIPATKFKVVALPVYLDLSTSAIPVGQVDDEPVTTWKVGTGGTQYNGQQVSLVCDGMYVGEITMGSDSEGAFTTPFACNTVVMGYLYTGLLKTMPIAAGAQLGSSAGRVKRIAEGVIGFYNSLGAWFGPSENNLEELTFRTPDMPMNEAPQYFSGEKFVTFPAAYERDYQVVIKQDKPYPLYVTGIAMKGITYD